MSNTPFKNHSVHFSKEQRVFQQLTNKDALIDALLLLYHSATGCQSKDTSSKFIQLYQPVYQDINKSKISLKDFQRLHKDTFVEGAFGTVTIVKSIHDNNIYALKTLNKSYLVDQIDRSSPMEERLILSNDNEEWLPKLYASFQDKKNLYLVMEYAHGGDLENLMERRNYHFNEQEAKFYCAELILAVERVHQLGYMHRDIKPANILIDSDGHIKLGDLGSCISLDTKDALFMVGTMPYISPEMCNSEGSDPSNGPAYGHEVDWWSVGIVFYELIYGVTPFTGKDIQIQMSLLNPKVSVQFDPKVNISPEAKDLLKRLLAKSKNDRLGKNGACEIKSHPFFREINWETLRTSAATPPFIPSIKSQDDITFFTSTANSENDAEEQDEEPKEEEEDDSLDKEYPFIGYTYSCSELQNKSPPKSTDNQTFLGQYRQKLAEPTNKDVLKDKLIETLKNSHQAEIDRLNAMIESQRKQIDQLASAQDLDIMESKSTSLLLANRKLESTNKELETTNNTLRAMNQKLQSVVEQHQVAVLELKSDNINLDVKNKEHQSVVKGYKSEIIELKRELKEQASINQELDFTIKTLRKCQQIQELSSKEAESRIQSLQSSGQKLEHKNQVFTTKNEDLESKCQSLDQQIQDLKSRNKHLENSLNKINEKQQDKVTDDQKTISILRKEIQVHCASKLRLEKKLLALEKEKMSLFTQTNQLKKQIQGLETQQNDLTEESHELNQQLKDQSADYTLLIQQSQAECTELRQNIQPNGTLRRIFKSLPNIPSSPGQGKSLLSTMWQRDKESLRHVQHALEVSENQLAYAKRQVVRLKKEVKYLQKRFFEGEADVLEHVRKWPLTRSPTEDVQDLANEPNIKRNKVVVLQEIEKEKKYIQSTERMMAARERLGRKKGDVNMELERSLDIARNKLSMLQSDL